MAEIKMVTNATGGGGVVDITNNNNNASIGGNLKKASKYAKRIVEEMSKRSKLLREPAIVALLDRDEVLPYLGECLGKGGFNHVFKLEKIVLTSECCDTEEERQALANNHKIKLAVKFLSDECLTSVEDACNGSADLLMEAKYLAALAAHPHPAIIKLHGIASAGSTGLQERAGFFLVLDRLYDTLDRRMEVWRELQRRKLQDDAAGEYNDKVQQYLKVLFLQRLIVATEVSNALEHLHSLRICFRDLKPDNVGFDYTGQVKVFDFGLSKELDPKQKTDDGLYKMSGGTGSRRYMSPEVALNEPYGLATDLYSFSILFWEVLSLEKAYGRLSVDEHKERVIRGSERLPVKWTKGLNQILADCWTRDQRSRPEAAEVKLMLRREIQDLVARDFPAVVARNSDA